MFDIVYIYDIYTSRSESFTTYKTKHMIVFSSIYIYQHQREKRAVKAYSMRLYYYIEWVLYIYRSL